MKLYKESYTWKIRSPLSHFCQHNRLVAEMSMEKKVRSQKGKNKTTEGRKQLSSVRVIQRNLVYIVGLPLNLADEDVCVSSRLILFLFCTFSLLWEYLDVAIVSLAASPAQGIFCSVWQGTEGINISYCSWYHSTFCK